MTTLQEKALQLERDHGFVGVPTRFKFPKGIGGWQQLDKTYEGSLWKEATGFALITGKTSKLTVVDVDEPSRAWYEKFAAKHELKPTTTVETPGGGLHLYYRYDVRLKNTQKLAGLDIDVRNDGGCIVGPGSSYESKGPKEKFNGVEYKLVRGWDELRDLDEIWYDIQMFGVDDLEVGEAPEPEPQEVLLDPTNGYKTTNETALMKLMVAIGRKDLDQQQWYLCLFAICKVAQDNGFDGPEFCVRWSSQIPKYDGAKQVLKTIKAFDYAKSPGLPYLLNQLQRNNQARIEFLKNFRRQYFYMDHVKLLAKFKLDGHLHLKQVHDFLSTALIKVNRAGCPDWYLRYKGDMDDWRRYPGHDIPFKGSNSGEFNFRVPKSKAELEKDKKDGKEPDPYKYIATSFKAQLIKMQYSMIPTYADIVFRPYYGHVPPCSNDMFNCFPGYRHKVYSEDEMKVLCSNKAFAARFKMVMNHWEETMCNENKEMFQYVLNWQAWLLKYGWKKPKTFLVFIGSQGLGKNLMWEELFVNGILGENLGHIVQDMKRFQSNFNMGRLNRCIHIFNECTCIQANNKVNWDMMKSLIDRTFTAEPKGKESFRAEDCGGNVFLSNHQMPVLVENDDRRYACTDMNSKHKADKAYWKRLADAVKDPCIQRAYFTMLIDRDVSHWNMRAIPDTKMRLQLKKNRSWNHILNFLENAVTTNGFTEWYQELETAKAWFSKARVQQGFVDYLNANTIQTKYQAWPNVERRLKQAGLKANRVTDRSIDGEKRQIVCFNLTKEIVKELHRKMLDNPKWEWTKVVDTDAAVADKDRCVFGNVELNNG